MRVIIRIDIVDDAAADRETLRALVERYCVGHAHEAHIRCFPSGEALLAERLDVMRSANARTSTQSFTERTEHATTRYSLADLIILDIQMDSLNGIETARRIRTDDEDVLILFVTNLAQYALDGYSVNACDFILKPVDCLQVFESLSKAFRRLQKRSPAKLSIRKKDGVVVIDPQQLLYIETYGRKLRLHREKDVIICSDTLQNLEQQLDSQLFFRCHNAYLVNLRHVVRLVGNEVEIAGERIPLSKHRRRQFAATLAAYLGELL
ncbi:MAG: LytR domain-containing response regulator [Coriobacteriales bacterium]|jgi:DNA-binding LytR/AlgR family response regulator|nr:LytR domain-containing response regulator [Coriobacteriales bacterium]